MMIKNEAKGGRGLGSDGTTVEWAPGEVKDVDAAFVAKAKKDPANAAMFDEGGGLVVVTASAARVSVHDEAGTEGAKDDDKKAARK